MERVFIAWSGNLSLARKVQMQMERRGLRGVVGGNTPEDMFIGSQVIEQMNSCSRAVILAKKKTNVESSEFSDNLMFEWGYLLAKLTSDKITAYLIDTHERDLPSDLIGSWVVLVQTEGKTEDEIAEYIVGSLRAEEKAIDKLDIMAHWQEAKEAISNYSERHTYSDAEVARLVLFSILSAYYYDEVGFFDRLLEKMNPSTPSLRAVISAARLMIKVYLDTSNLANPLSISDYFELTTMLQNPYEEEVDKNDPELRQWVKILRYDYIHLCNILIANSAEADEAELYHQEAIQWAHETLQAIDEDLEARPENERFAAVLRSFRLRNLSLSHFVLGEEDQAMAYLDESIAYRGKYYFWFQQEHPSCTLLCSRFAQEYYLALLERAKYETNSLKRRQILMTVKKYLGDWEEEFTRQQTLLHLVQAAYTSLSKEEAQQDNRVK